MQQVVPKQVSGLGVDSIHGLAQPLFFLFCLRILLFRQFNLVTPGQGLQGRGKIKVMIFHHKGEDIPGLATTKTVIKLLTGMHREGRGFLAMKRTTPQKPRSRTFQINALADDLHDISLFFDQGCY